MSHKWKSLGSLSLVWLLILQIGIGSTLPAFADTPDEAAAESQKEEKLSDESVQSAEEFNKELEHLDQVLAGESTRHRLDMFGTLDQEAFKHPDAKKIKPKNLVIRIHGNADSGHALLDTVKYNKKGSVSHQREVGYFDIVYQDQVIHRFNRAVSSVALYGDYLVFIEPSSFVENGDGVKVQNVSFIDLDYFGEALGHGIELPIFRVPLALDQPASKIEINNGLLEVGGEAMPGKVFEAFSEGQQIAFNVQVNLLNPKTYESAGAAVDSFTEAFEHAVQLSGDSMGEQLEIGEGFKDSLKSLSGDIQKQLEFRKKTKKASDREKQITELADYADKGNADEVARRLNLSVSGARESEDPYRTVPQEQTSAREIVRNFHHKFQAEQSIQKSMESMGEQMRAQRKLISRIGLLWARLSLPQPTGAPTIRNALAAMAMGFKNKTLGDMGEGALRFINTKLTKRGAPLIAAAILGATNTVDFAHLAYSVMDMGATIGSAVWGKICDLGYLAKNAIGATFEGFNPVYFKEAYLNAETFPKLVVGVSAIVTTLYITLGAPHLIVNAFKLAKDLRNADFSEYEAKQMGFFRKWKQAFIDRQKKEQADYLETLAAAEAEAQGLDRAKKFTEEQNKEVDRIIGELEAQKKNTWSGRMKERLSNWGVFKRFANKSNGEIETFRKALMHFFFSYASFTNSGYAYTKIWNGWFAVRSFVLKSNKYIPFLLYPDFRKWITFLIYPQYFSTLTGNGGKTVVPSELNGGKRTRWQTWRLKYEKIFHKSKELALLEAFEKKMIPVEEKIQKEALAKAFDALVQYMDNSEDINKLYERGGINKVTDDVIEELSRKQKVFFRAYFTNLSDRAMELFLREYVEADVRANILEFASGEEQELSYDEVKDLATQQTKEIKITEGDAKRFIDRALATPEVFNQADELANRKYSWDAIKLNQQYNLLSELDPSRNRQVNRIMSVKKAMAKPKAMARAVRSMIASNLVDKPLELAFVFVCYAGITEGLLQPIQAEKFSENSWFYLSKALFTNGFIYGVLSGVLADTWMKLQQDEANEGNFDQVPTGKEAKMGFGRYYWTKAWKDPDTSWWKLQKHYHKLIWANMKAAFITYFSVNLITMGRFDVDMYTMGYLGAYLLPLGGLAYKFEQAFEKATPWLAKDIPAEYRSHPKVQGYLNKEAGRKRLWFNFFYKTYENIMGNLVNAYTTMKTARLGGRSLSRVVLGGYNATELVVIGTDKLANALDFIPGARDAIHYCQHLFTNKFTDFSKIPNPNKK